MASTFEVLAEPTRRSILDLLRERERSVGELVSRLTISQPGVSKHLRVLREAGLVEYRLRGRNKDARLRRDVVESRFPGLLDGVLRGDA